MPHHTITHEITPVATRDPRVFLLPYRWIVREDGKEIGAFETEQEAMEYRDKLKKLSDPSSRNVLN
jgi:hypothetical protein